MKYFKCDVLRFLTVGNMAHYGFLLNLPQTLLFKKLDKNENTKKEIKNKLFLCDQNENEMIIKYIYMVEDLLLVIIILNQKMGRGHMKILKTS